MKTEIVKISEVVKNPNNPRIIKNDKFDKLVASIKELPKMLEIRPIVVNDEMIVLGGNMRLEACKAAGLIEVPIIKASDLTEDQQRQFIIKDNVGFGEWDWDMLANEWDQEELEDWGMELPPNYGFMEAEAQEDDYEVPDEVKTDIKLGDLIEIGPHRLLCGDSTKKEHCEKLMNGRLADMIHTDPPYNIAYGETKNPRHKIRSIENDKMSNDDWEDFCKNLYVNFQEFNKGDIYMWGASAPEGMRMRLWLIEMGCHWSATIIWKKDQLVLSPAKYQRLYEPCFYGWFDKSSFKADRKQVELWEVDRPKRSKEHPTMKPIELCAKAINNSSKERDIVLDFFLGSGSTMLASHQVNRVCYGIELDPKYCQVIVDRMKNYEPSLEIKINGQDYGKS